MAKNDELTEKQVNKKAKARYWVGVCYEENMVDGWEEKIGDILELPYAYCRHNADKDALSEHRKDHVHIILVFPNTTTYNHAYNAFMKLSAPGKKCIPYCESINSIRSKYEYLIHNTETAKKQGKYQYAVSDRKTGNNFDIGAYEQLSQAEKDEILKNICDLIYSREIINCADLYSISMDELGPSCFDVFKTHSGFLERLTKGIYMKQLIRSRH